MTTIFIDESGTLPDLNDKFVVICGVTVKKIKEAQNIFSRISGSLKSSGINLKEIKFYHSGSKTKKKFLSGMVLANFDIFILIVNKKDRKIADSPDNFAILVADLINEIGLWYNFEEINFIIDKHFHRRVDENKFNNIIKMSISKGFRYQLNHVDSQQNSLVNIADMVAGSVLRKYNKKNMEFYNIIKENIIVEKIISWPDIKRKSLN